MTLDRPRRAFAFPLMLVVLLSASLIVTVAVQRQAAQTRTIERQLNDYKRRHDAHGVRAIVLHWLKNIPRSELAELSTRPGPAHVFELPSGARAAVTISDGQGLPVRDVTAVDDELQPLYQEMLARLRGRPDLTRGAGPWTISVAGAPREVLEAMSADNGPALAEELLRMRRVEDGIDRAEFSRAMTSMTMDAEDRRFIMRVSAFDSTLWKITVDTEDWSGRRRYDMLVERSATQTTVHEWFEHAEADLSRMRASAGADRESDRWR